SEIWKPLVGSTITPIVVFVPLISITGVTGVFFRALALTVGVALLTSLAMAMTWTPTLSHFLLRRKPRKESQSTEEHPKQGFFARVLRLYDRVLRFTLRHGWVLAIFVAVLILGSYFC